MHRPRYPSLGPCATLPGCAQRGRAPPSLALALLLSGCGDASASVAPPSETPASHAEPALSPGRQPRAAPAARRPAAGRCRWSKHGPRAKKRIALTFDADLTTGMRARLRSGKVDVVLQRGPDHESCAACDVPATMFLTGLWMEQYPSVTRTWPADPLFELGTHSQTHRAFTSALLRARHRPAEGDAPRGHPTRSGRSTASIRDATRYFRFPGGCSDDAALRRTAAAGVTAIGTDLAGGDGHARSADAIANTVLRGAGTGTIVTLHMHGGDIVPLTDEAVAKIVKKPAQARLRTRDRSPSYSAEP